MINDKLEFGLIAAESSNKVDPNKPIFAVNVVVKDSDEQAALYQELSKRGFKCKPVVV